MLEFLARVKLAVEEEKQNTSDEIVIVNEGPTSNHSLNTSGEFKKAMKHNRMVAMTSAFIAILFIAFDLFL